MIVGGSVVLSDFSMVYWLVLGGSVILDGGFVVLGYF